MTPPAPAKAAAPVGLMPMAVSSAAVSAVHVPAVTRSAASSAMAPPPPAKAAAPIGLMPMAVSSAAVSEVHVPAVTISAAPSAVAPPAPAKAATPVGLMPMAVSSAALSAEHVPAVTRSAAPSAVAPPAPANAAASAGLMPMADSPATMAVARRTGISASSRKTPTSVAAQVAVPGAENFFLHLKSKPAVNWIPKSARSQVATLLCRLIDAVLCNNDWESWQKLLSFAPVCLSGNDEEDSEFHTLAQKVKHKVSNFDKIWKNTTNSKPKQNKSRKDQRKQVAKIVSKKISEGDIKGAVRVASSADTLAPNTPETTDKLQNLHPPLLHDLKLDDLAPSTTEMSGCLMVDEQCIKMAIASFRPGSAAGPSGLRPQHLKNLTSKQLGEPAVKLLTSLSSLANLILRGEVPENVRPYFFSAKLTALAKKNGGVRPIACGNAIRRLVAKAACHLISGEQGHDLRPLQMGVATKNGCEAIAHAVRRFLFASKSKVLFKIDFANAFNSISRRQIIEQVRIHAPCIHPLVWCSYSQPAILFHNGQELESREGVQQGDPLGSLYFSRGIHPIVRKCRSELNAWYLDDGTIGGDPKQVIEDCIRIQAEGKAMGLELNASKCELCVLDIDAEGRDNVVDQFKAAFPGVKVISASNLDLLGAPMDHSMIPSVLEEKIEALRQFGRSLMDLDAHDGLFLLRNCLSLPKLLYTLRCSPCFLDSQSLSRYDTEIASILQKILNVELSEHSWMQASLPVKFGGLGVRRATDVAIPAYMASVSQCEELSNSIWQGHSDDMNRVREMAVDQWLCQGLIVPDDPKIQKKWDHMNCNKQANVFKELSHDPEDKARLLASTAEGAGDWLNVFPIPSLGLKLSNADLRIAVALRLGLKICEPHNCLCGKRVRSNGAHGLSCSRSKGRLPRHSMVNDLIKRALSSAGIPSTLEPVGLSRGDGKRPDGLTYVPWSNGKCLTWDFTCPDTLAPSHLADTSMRESAAANAAERLRASKYADIGDSYNVVPVAIETLGSYGQSATAFIGELGLKIIRETGEKMSKMFLRQAISIAIQRGNAMAVLGTLPSTKSLLEVFYL